MPKRGRRQTQSAEIGKKRWSIEDFPQMDSSDDDNVIGNEKNITLRHFNITWRATDNFMSAVGGMRCMTAQKWAEIFLTGDFEMFVKDDRGGKQGESFFDVHPELEIAAKLYVAEACSQKSAVFKALDLANYIDSQYYELTNTNKSNNELIRSERMCRLDLRR
ncbi:unnamed protein product [Didymodactylos carnosus]|uniref:Uncharacterized protein n=1 Tax=Didymodactylos carnosus TaxID=1234261 RepID=A0A8S2F2R4_9BILA|nr:unnamed protein product [Didymodactylos carnosus]CAF4112732.1 unnamed protein product [Didymodactylos carnosus]